MAAFAPSRSYSITVTTTASTPVQTSGGRQLLFTNSGANVVHVTVGGVATNATVAAATATNSFPILGNQSIIVDAFEGAFVSAIATAVGNTLIVTTGSGDER